MRSPLPISAAIALCAASAAHADIMYLTQERRIDAATTANAALLTQSAPDFAPFVATLTSSTTFQSPTGPATNTGETTIDCQLDPNAIRANGSLTGAGGLNISGQLEAGEAAAFILVTFNITEATPFNLLCTPCPSSDPRDEFEIELVNLTTTTDIFALTQDDPAQDVDINGILQPGTYSLKFQVEMTVETLQSTQAFDFRFLVPSPASATLLAAAPLLRRRRR